MITHPAFKMSSLLAACCIAAMTPACSQDASEAASAAVKTGQGGGNAELQETLADPAPMGTLALETEILGEGLEQPWGITFLPDETILVAERPGRIRIIRDGEMLAEPVAGAPEPFVNRQAGYFDVLPHPDFENNNWLYLAYAHGTGDANALRIIRGKFDGAALTDIEQIYEATPLKDTSHHYGGKMLFHPDGKLYFTVGEGSKYKEYAQKMDTSFGAVIRLNPDGSIPDDNPEWEADEALPELYSKGHRNGQGFVYDAERDVLWENEHGPRGGDEINVIEPGANYGWPLASYGIDYNGAKITPFTEYEGTVQPFKYWTPSIATSGMAVYRGDLFPADWDGDLLVGALAGQALHRIELDGMEIVGEERYLTDLGKRIRDVRVGPDGAIYVAAEEREGAGGLVVRVTPQ